MSIFDEISSFVERIPPLTRYICVSTLILSLSAQFGVVNPNQLILDMKQVVNFQFWRLITCMCLSSGFGLLMHLYFMHSWLSSLENGTFRGRKGDCFMMLMFIMLSLSVIGMAAKLVVLTNSFSMAIVYIWSSLNPQEIVQFMFGLRFKAALLPWVFLGFDVLQGGSPIPGIIGIIVGYSYHFLENIYPSTHNGSKLFFTPEFVKNAFDPLDPREMASSGSGYSSQPGKPAKAESFGTFGGQGESSPEEYLKVISINYGSWGHPLSLEDYIDREFTLGKVAREFRRSWVLMRGEEILSSCETYETPLIAKIDNMIINGSSFGVASVFTPPEHRGNSYATSMMKMLYEKIFSDKQDLIGSHLYSDVGPNFYSKLGWDMYPLVSAEIDVGNYKSIKPRGLINTISIPDLELLLKNDVERLVANMNNNTFLLQPTTQSISWLHARSVFIAEKTGKPFVTSIGVGYEDAFLLWFLSFKENCMYVIRLHDPTKSKIPNLIEAAVGQAIFYGLSKIVIWNPDVEYWSKIDSVKIVDREDSLSSMAIHYKGLKLENFGWMQNEKYSWV